MSHPLGRTKAETFTLMFLTRLAMFFERQGNNRFTGEVVAQVILGAWQSYELSKETPEIERFLAAYLPDPAADAHTGDLIDSLVSTVEKAEAAHGPE